MKRYLSILIILLISFCSMAFKVTDVGQIKGNESKVTEIYLSNKGFTEFPSEVLACKNVRILDLSNNGFVKIPLELSELEHLQVLNLSDNNMISPVDLETLLDSAKFKLESLSLSNCALYDLPISIGNQDKLLRLDISQNQLLVLPHSMMNFTKLKKIDLSDNELQDIRWFCNYWWSLDDMDASGNKELDVAGLLHNLSFFDHLNTVTISNVHTFPQEFVNFGCNELVIKNSTIRSFPRSKKSPKINKLIFENCKFKNEDEIVKVLNGKVKPSFVGFHMMKERELAPFLSLKTDSLDLRFNKFKNIMPLVSSKQLKWLDIRANQIDQNALTKFAQTRTDIEILFKEPVIPNIGIKPPIEKFIPTTTRKKVSISNSEKTDVQLGRTTLQVPQNAILTKDGKPYNGEVTFEYREFSNPVQTFLAGIPMTYTDKNDETFMFSSGGMFSLTAKDEQGNDLMINQENPINVQMTSNSASLDMDLWELNEDGVWVKKGKDKVLKPFELDSSKLDSISALDYYKYNRRKITFVRDRYVPKVSEKDKYGNYTMSFDILETIPNGSAVITTEGEIEVRNTEYTSKFIADRWLNVEGDSADYFFNRLNEINAYCHGKYESLKRNENKHDPYYTKEGANFISELELVIDHENDGFRLQFYFKDSLMSIPVSQEVYSEQPKDLMQSDKKFFKAYQKAEMEYSKTIVKNFASFQHLIKIDGEARRKAALWQEEYRQKNTWEKEGMLNSQATKGSIVRMFQLDQFGVWNCDQLARMQAPTTIAKNMINQNGDNMPKNYNQIMIIDHTNNGVLRFERGEKASFDKKAVSAIVVFFSALSVGIFRSWKDRYNGNTLKLNVIDLNNVSNEEFQNLLTP